MDREEKRKRTRVYRFKGDVEILSEEYGTEQGRCRDLSLKGMFLSYAGRLEKGRSCTVRIPLAIDGEPFNLSITGEVVRRTPEGIAVDFQGMEPDSFTHLRRLVQLHSDNPDFITRELTKPAFE